MSYDFETEHQHMIFVFGSNLSGIHGAGAARYAHKNLGAKWGCGIGLTGHCYALPTKGINITFMSLDEVRRSIQHFTSFAYQNQGADFKVTQVGCGLGGFRKEEIAPMFEYAAHEMSNCYFDTAWKELLPENAKFWGTF
jgi:hypothetical protein